MIACVPDFLWNASPGLMPSASYAVPSKACIQKQSKKCHVLFLEPRDQRCQVTRIERQTVRYVRLGAECDHV